MTIKELAADERPREKMLQHGPALLTTAELIAVLLRTGTRKENALEVARNLLKEADGSLLTLCTLLPERLCAVPGVGLYKAVTVLAALELGRRFFLEEGDKLRREVTGPEIVYEMMLPLLKGLDREECWVLYLNRSNFVVHKERFSRGGIDGTVVDVKVIVRQALERRSSTIILVHNHPSGNPRPGKGDSVMTERLRHALRAVDLSLMDHVIISNDCYFSFAEDRVGRVSPAVPASSGTKSFFK